MATKAQIAANRSNARKSTGPRTAEGKARSSRNASRPRSSLDPNPTDVAAVYFSITGKDLFGEGGAADPILFRLAVAEARLSLARRKEQIVLSQSDDARRLLPEFDAICEILEEQAESLDPVSMRVRSEGSALKLKLRSLGARASQTTFRRLLRDLREAEREQLIALSNWIDQS